MNRPTLHLLGVDEAAPPVPKLVELLGKARALVLSQRHERLFGACLAGYPRLTRIPIAPVDAALARAQEALSMGDVVFLASGDPLFFGIGRTLLGRFAPDQLQVYPALSSMQRAFARFQIPWDDAQFLSLHGREATGIAARILGHPKSFLFTDQRLPPNRIAQLLLDCCGLEQAEGIEALVAENLGLSEERMSRGSLATISTASFAPLNVMLVLQPGAGGVSSVLGLDEEEIRHSRGLITKNEVRAVTLHRLNLPSQGVFWDIGAGSGSISLEAARLCPGLAVYSVEAHEEQVAHIRANRQHFGAWNLELVSGEAPDALRALPRPDAVFVGGSGGRLREIIALAGERLRPGGTMVVNAVLARTGLEAPMWLAEQGLCVDISEVAVTRYQYPDTGAQALNPIRIIRGRKRDEREEEV